MTCLRVDLLEFILFEVLYDSYNWICVFFFRFRKFSTIILSNTFSNFSLSSPSGIPRTWMLVHLILSQRSLNCSFCFVFHLGVLLGVLHFSIFQTIYVFSYEAGRHWEQEEKGTTEDEVAGWHHRLDGHEFEWTLGVGDGQEGLACCNSWGCKESDMIERLNWTEDHSGRRKWQPTPVFLLGESQGWGSLVGCCLWGCTELDTTEVT